MFRRRIVVVVEDGLRERVKKKLFSHKKKISLLDDNKGYISVSLPGRCIFSYFFLILWDRTGCGEKRIRRSKRVATRKIKNTNRNKIKTLQKLKKNAYSDFIPPDLTVMVASWENGNLFEWKEKCPWMKQVLRMQWNSPLSPKMYRKSRKWRWGNSASWSQSTTGAGLQTGSDTMFDNTGIPTEDEHLQ